MRGWLTLLLIVTLVGWASAQTTEKPKEGKRAENAKKAGSALTPEREAAVMTFVKLNHADLEMLLTHLKQSDPKEYDRAVRDLMRVIDRLAATKEKDPDSYTLELRSWKAQSRLQLLAARQSMGSTEDIRDQMRQIINEQCEVRAETLRREKQRIEERASKIDQELTRLEKGREKFIEQQLKQLAPVATAAATESKPAENSLAPAETKPVEKPTVASEPTAKKPNNAKPNKPADKAKPGKK